MSGELPIDRSVTKSEIYSAIETQARVVVAIMLHETKSRYGEHSLGFFWVMIEPMLFIAGFAVMNEVLGGVAPHGMDPKLYMMTGMVPFLLFRGTMSRVSGAISSNKALLGFPQVTTFDLIISRALLEFATSISVFTILVIMMLMLGVEIDIERPMAFFGAFCLMFVAGFGIGSTLSVVAPFYPSTKQLAGVLFGRPLFFTSGVFFTVDQFPTYVREILLYNPLLHVLEWARSAFFKSFESAYVDLEYAGLFLFWLLVFGLTLHQALHKRVLGI